MPYVSTFEDWCRRDQKLFRRLRSFRASIISFSIKTRLWRLLSDKWLKGGSGRSGSSNWHWDEKYSLTIFDLVWFFMNSWWPKARFISFFISWTASPLSSKSAGIEVFLYNESKDFIVCHQLWPLIEGESILELRLISHSSLADLSSDT